MSIDIHVSPTSLRQQKVQCSTVAQSSLQIRSSYSITQHQSNSQGFLAENNCTSERDSVLETQRDSPEGEELYIPSCTIDGQYERVQCYQG